uniref:Uncharacterized protein n=1 Tax=Alexandrium monilatum TaxID=311494 RepID=A0A7S4S7E5_9DINO
MPPTTGNAGHDDRQALAARDRKTAEKHVQKFGLKDGADIDAMYIPSPSGLLDELTMKVVPSVERAADHPQHERLIDEDDDEVAAGTGSPTLSVFAAAAEVFASTGQDACGREARSAGPLRARHSGRRLD